MCVIFFLTELHSYSVPVVCLSTLSCAHTLKAARWIQAESKIGLLKIFFSTTSSLSLLSKCYQHLYTMYLTLQTNRMKSRFLVPFYLYHYCHLYFDYFLDVIQLYVYQVIVLLFCLVMRERRKSKSKKNTEEKRENVCKSFVFLAGWLPLSSSWLYQRHILHHKRGIIE